MEDANKKYNEAKIEAKEWCNESIVGQPSILSCRDRYILVHAILIVSDSQECVVIVNK